jgi:hypothetical protein
MTNDDKCRHFRCLDGVVLSKIKDLEFESRGQNGQKRIKNASKTHFILPDCVVGVASSQRCVQPLTANLIVLRHAPGKPDLRGLFCDTPGLHSQAMAIFGA